MRRFSPSGPCGSTGAAEGEIVTSALQADVGFISGRATTKPIVGFDFNRSSYATPLVTKSAEFFWGDEFTFKLSGATSLVQTFRMFNDLSHTGDYRVNGDIGASTHIAKWLTWNLALSDRYLSHPAPGRKTNDFLYTTGLGITFAR